MSDTDLVAGVDLLARAARPRQERARRRRGLRGTACRLVTERCACGRGRWGGRHRRHAGNETAWEGGRPGAHAETSETYYRFSRGRAFGRRHRPPARYLLWDGLERSLRESTSVPQLTACAALVAQLGGKR